MKALVSCPNLQGALSRFSLAVVDLGEDRVQWVDTTAFVDPKHDLGITGVAIFPDMVLLAVQSPARPRLVKLTGALEYRETIEVPGLRDPHGIAVAGRVALLASTGTNEVLAVDVDTGQSWKHWSFPETNERDVLHLSSIATHEGRILASTHNDPRPGEGRSGCGCIFELATGEILVDGLERPHSLTSIDGHLHFLNSSSGGIVRLDPEGRVEEGPKIEGFARGIAAFGDRLVVGSSSHRLHSRKLGVMTPNQQMTEGWMSDLRFRSSISIVDHASLYPRRSVDFTLLAPEIFDICILSADPSPAVLLDDAMILRAASQRHELWRLRYQVERQHAQIDKLKTYMGRRRLHEKAVIRQVQFNGVVLSGTAFDPDRPEAAIHIRAAIDNRHVFYARADLARSEGSVAEVRRPRFALQVPPSVLGRDRHRIELDVPDAATCEKVVLELTSNTMPRNEISGVPEISS